MKPKDILAFAPFVLSALAGTSEAYPISYLKSMKPKWIATSSGGKSEPRIRKSMNFYSNEQGDSIFYEFKYEGKKEQYCFGTKEKLTKRKKFRIKIDNSFYDVLRVESPAVSNGGIGDLYFEGKCGITPEPSIEDKKKIELASLVASWSDDLPVFVAGIKSWRDAFSSQLISDAAASDAYNNQNYETQILDDLYSQHSALRTDYEYKIKNLEVEIERLDKKIKEYRTAQGANILKELANVLDKGINAYSGSDEPYRREVERMEQQKEDKQGELKYLKDRKYIESDRLYNEQKIYRERLESRKEDIQKSIEPQVKETIAKASRLEKISAAGFENCMPEEEYLKSDSRTYYLIYSSHLVSKFEKALNIFREKMGNGEFRNVDYSDIADFNDLGNLIYINFEQLYYSMGMGRTRHDYSNYSWEKWLSDREEEYKGTDHTFKWLTPEAEELFR